MNVPEGFKQTEVGVIPRDWSVISAADACQKIQDGTHFSPKTGGNDYLYVTSKNIRNGFLDFSTAGRIDKEQHELIYKRCDVKKGDILFTKDGANTGNAAINTLQEEFSLLSSVAFLRVKEIYEPSYFLQQILSSEGQKQIQEAMSGNAITTRLTLEKINKLVFPLPPTRAEQTAIAAALSDMDALIEGVEKLLEKKRRIKQGAMQELLTGKRRLSGFESQAGFQQTEVGMIPKDWEVETISEIASVKTGPFGSLLHKKDYVSSGTPIVTVEHLGEYGIASENTPNVSDSDKSRLKEYILCKHDIVFSRVGSIDRSALVSDYETGWLFSGRLLRVRVITRHTKPTYLNYHFKSESFRRMIYSVAVGQTMASLNTEILKRVKVPLPPPEEQTAIAAILSDMDSEIEQLEKRLAKYRQIKTGIMQELLTGKKRLL